ncbi:MAG TPA: hypothetical protein VN847_23880 [Streptosporangiaceae bacterium]|nr:hypothetical protein [Streptosporangiaceae bacterium]
MGGLTGRPAGNSGPAAGNTGPAPDQVTAGLYRRSQLALGAAFVVLVGAVVAFALHARTVGIVLLVLMLLGGMASFWFSVKFRNRAVAEAREARREQAVRVARNRKSGRPGSD